MAKIDIETYRGFEITFDTDDGKFSAWADEYDTEFAKPSFKSVKKGIDDYIRKNNEFRPFKIQKINTYGNNVDTIQPPIRVIGIRKDNRFVVDVGGKKEQLSDHTVSQYVVYNPQNDKVIEELKSFHNREKETTDALRAEKKEILGRVTYTKTLAQKRDEILNNQ